MRNCHHSIPVQQSKFPHYSFRRQINSFSGKLSLSIGRLEAAGGHAVFKNGSCSLYMKGKLAAKGKRVRHLYELNAKTIFPIESVSVANQSRQLSWNEAHRTLGHLSLTSMKKIFQNELITGIHVDPNVAP